MATLYEIDRNILECIDQETGEVIDYERLDALSMAKCQKIENAVCWIKNLRSDALAFKAEKESFAEREQAATKKAEQLEKWLTAVLGGYRFDSARCVVSFRKSEAVEVKDVKLIPAELLRVKTTVEADKSAIKAAIKSGHEVNGCELVEKINIQIK